MIDESQPETAVDDIRAFNRLGDFGRNRLKTFAALQNRNYRWYWVGMLASFNAMQMQMVARGWLVYTLTDSALSLGLVMAGFGIPMVLLSLHAGAIADRVDKRRMLLITRGGMGLVALVITLLIAFDRIALWHLMLASVVSGTFVSFFMPARQAFIMELVGKDALLNAIALNAMAMNLCRIASPALAGVLLKVIGISGVYWIISISGLLVVFSLFMISPPERENAGSGNKLTSDVLEGLRYVRRHRIILMLLLMVFVPIVVAMPYQVLMPVFARDVFAAGETGLGLLMSAVGLGALTGSTLVATLGNYQRKGRLTMFSGLMFGLFLLLFGMSPAFSAALVCLLLVGAGSSIYMSVNVTLIMSHTPEDMVGRVMSIYMMTFGLLPLATLPVGAVAEAWGAPLTVAGGGGVLLVFVALIMLLQPEMRRLK